MAKIAEDKKQKKEDESFDTPSFNRDNSMVLARGCVLILFHIFDNRSIQLLKWGHFFIRVSIPISDAICTP